MPWGQFRCCPLQGLLQQHPVTAKNLSCEFRDVLRRKRLKKRREERIFLGPEERGEWQGTQVAEWERPMSELCAPKFI